MTTSILNWAFLLLLLPQEKFPAEDDAWLRFKTGTWIENKITVEADGAVIESFQKQTLKEKAGGEYVIEETGRSNGQDLPARRSRKNTGTITGTETILVDGKEYPCQISTAKGQREEGDVEVRYWMPKGNKYPLKVVFKQKNLEGEISAVEVDEKMTVGDREYLCARLQGKVKFGLSEGTMTVWLSQEIPGAQVRAELSLKGPGGDVRIRAVPSEVHVEK